MRVCSRWEQLEITALAKKTRSKRMPEVVILRMPMKSQSKSEIMKERSSIDRTVEWVVSFVADKHYLSARGRVRVVGMRGGIVGTELRLPARRWTRLSPPYSSGLPDHHLR